MDPRRFDRLTQMLFTAGSRRAALGALLSGAGTALGLVRGQRAAAQVCTANGIGCCKANGRGCHTGDDCCSGLCKRKNDGKKICKQADNQGECTVEENVCASGSSIACGTQSGGGGCLCFVTASGRSFCGDGSSIQSGDCDCTSNKECERRIGKGAKCVQAASGGPDFCGCPSSTSGCMAPCPTLDPVP